MTTVTAPASQAGEPQATSQDALQQIADLATHCRSATAFYRGVLEVASRHFGAFFAAMNLSHATESLDEHITTGDASHKTWQRVTRASILESEATGVALARLYDIDGTDQRVAVLSVPIHDDRQHTGSLALVTHFADRATVETVLYELRALTLLACSLASSVHAQRDHMPAGPDAVQRALAKAARYHSLTELAFAITNGLKTKFQCEQVILGKVDRGRVRILSLSGMDALYPRSPGMRLIQQAMEECLDYGQVICSKPREEWSDPASPQDFRLHRQWRSTIGDAAVASIPLFADDDCVAVLSLVRPGSVGFPMGELEGIEQLACVYGPAIQLVARAHRSWFAQTGDCVQEGLRWLCVRNHWGRKVMATAVVLLAAWFCLGTVHYRISTSCQVIPQRVQHFAAPFEGILQSVHVAVGDQVKAGQLLVAMDTRELDLQQCELESEAAVAELEISQYVAGQQIQAAALARARLEVIRARLARVTQRIKLSEVRAPSDGTIMAGHAKDRVGDVVPLGEPLLEFAAHGNWGVELRVEGRHGALVQTGQPGRFVTVANPDQPVACVVDRVEPSATVVDGKHVFVARANLPDNAAWSLAGMDGVATLDVGPRRVWWVALHRVIDFVRLHFWI